MSGAMVELDFSGFDKDLARGEVDDVSVRLGVDVDAAVFGRFTAWSEKVANLKRARLLVLIRKALWAPDGFVWERTARPYTTSGTHVLAVKWLDGTQSRVTIGVSEGPGGPDALWPELEGWSETLSENRARVDAWARVTAEDRVTVTVRSDVRIQQLGDDSAFVRAIVDDPDNDTLRLAYADWLEERGDVRAELIREQLGLVTKYEGRHHDILETSWPELAGELRPWANPYGFEGGMVADVRMPAEAFLSDGERLFARHPLRKLSVDSATRDASTLKRIGQSPALRRVESLSLSCEHGRPLAAFAKSPHLERLKHLALLGGGHSTKDWVELFGNLRAPALESVLFISVRTHPLVLRTIAENPSLGALVRVNEASVDELLPDEPFAAVKRLFRGDDLVVATKRFAARPAFTQLGLFQANVTDAVIEPFFSSSSQASLEWLEVVGTKLTDATLQLLARSARTNALTRVEIIDASFSAAAVCAFLKSETAVALRVLTIGLREGRSWTSAEFSAVYEALLARPKLRLEEVKLPKNPQRDEAKWMALQHRFEMSEWSTPKP